MHTAEWSNSSVEYKLTKLNGTKYCYVSLTIQLNLSHLFTQLDDQPGLY